MQEQQQQPYRQGRNKFQLQRAGDDGQPPGTVLKTHHPTQQTQTLKFGKNKLVRASPTLIAQLREQAAGRGGSQAARQGPRASAPAAGAAGAATHVAQPGPAPAARPTATAPPPHRSNTWNRVVQHQQPQQQENHPRQPVPVPVSSLLSSHGAPAATQLAAPAAAVAAPGVKLPGRLTPVTAPAATITAKSSSRAKTVAVLSSGSGGQQRLLVYKKGQRGKSLQRTAVKAAARGHLTWRNPATAAAAPAAPKPVAPLIHSSSSGGSAGGNLQQHGGCKNARAAAAEGGSPVTAAKPPTRIAIIFSKRSPSSGRQSSSSRTSGGKTGGSKLLRLGSSVYKMVGHGNGKSLQRQSSQQHLQPVAAPAGALAAGGARDTALRLAAAPVASSAAAEAAVAAMASGTQKLTRYKLISAAVAAAAAARKRRSLATKAGTPAIAAAAVAAALKVRGSIAKPSGSAVKHRRRQVLAAAGGSGRLKIVHCPLYCRTGKCDRRGKGCPYKHDSTKRAVCPRWLHGRCEAGTQCSLQHQRKQELMPVCMHFLKGRCTADACPYLHINLPPAAPVCKRFLRGYCPAGAACPHKHYTLGMVREEKSLGAVAAAAGKDSVGGSRIQADGGGKKQAVGRYFDGDDAAAAAVSSESVDKEEEEGTEAQQQQQQPARKRRRRGAALAAVASVAGADGGGSGASAGEVERRRSDALKPAFLLGSFVLLE